MQKQIALLIDADNTTRAKLADILAHYDQISVKRAYANWNKPYLKNWEPTLRCHGIRAIQQFDCAAGKNATDIALCVDAMDLLHTHLYDTFILLASDSDYTPLVMKLRESAVRVIGIGNRAAPEAYRSACSEFLYLESFDNEKDESDSGLIDDLFLTEEAFAAEISAAEASSPTQETIPTSLFDELSDDDFGWEIPSDTETPVVSEFSLETLFSSDEEGSEKPEMQNIHRLLEIIFACCKDESGFALLSSAGNLLRELKPDFDPRTYGHKNLSLLLSAYPDRYQIIHIPNKGNADILAYRCRS